MRSAESIGSPSFSPFQGAKRDAWARHVREPPPDDQFSGRPDHLLAEALNEANQRLEALSRCDGLTGLVNRRYFDAVLHNEWRRAARSGETLALVMLDVDFFKKYNDHYGHLEGDQCLRTVAESADRVARLAAALADGWSVR